MRSDVYWQCRKCNTRLTEEQAHDSRPHIIKPRDGKGPLTAGGKPVVCDGRSEIFYREGWLLPGRVPVRTLIAGLVFACVRSCPAKRAVELTDELISELRKGEDT